MRFIYLVFLFFCIGCAQQGALSGGPKDVITPKLISVKDSTITNCKKNEFILEFDENIQFLNGKTSLLINPSIKDYDIKVEKNKLLINWEDTLDMSTTYSFIFLESIADLTEKNKIPQFRHTFSTGNVIDSGNINGNVIILPEQTVADEFLIQLKNIDNKSIVYNGFTDEKGNFKIKNIKSGKYILCSFKDENKNYELDTLREIHGYFSDTLNITDSIYNVEISCFNPDQKTTIEKTVINDVNCLTIDFNQIVDSCIIYDTINKNTYCSIKKSKSHDFYLKDTLDKHLIIINSTLNKFCDTIRVSNKTSKNITKKINFKKEEKTNLIYQKSLSLLLNQHIISVDTANIKLSKDSVSVNYSISNKDNILNILPLSESGNFSVIFYPNSFKGIKHHKTDTSIVNFNITSNEELSNLNLKIKNIEHSSSILQIISNDKIKKEFSFKGNLLDTSFFNCIPGSYNLKLIADADENNYWSKGNLLNKLQPEKIYTYEGEIKLQKNWTADITWDFNPKE